MTRNHPDFDLQAQCSGQREQPVEMSRGIEGISPEVEGASLAGGMARRRVVGNNRKEVGRVRLRGALWGRKRSLCFTETVGSHRGT